MIRSSGANVTYFDLRTFLLGAIVAMLTAFCCCIKPCSARAQAVRDDRVPSKKRSKGWSMRGSSVNLPYGMRTPADHYLFSRDLTRGQRARSKNDGSFLPQSAVSVKYDPL